MVIDGTTGALTWTPCRQQGGIHDVALAVQNELGKTRQPFTLTRPLAEAPRISGTANLTATVSLPYAYDADDYVDVTGVAEGERVELRILTAPAGLSVAPRRYEVGWVPSEAGTAEVSLALVAGGEILDTSEFAIEVSEATAEAAQAVLELDAAMGDAAFDVRFDGSASLGAGGAPVLRYLFSPGDG